METKTLNYKGYSLEIKFSEADNLYYGKVATTTDLLLCEGDDEEELEKDFHAAVDHYLSEL